MTYEYTLWWWIWMANNMISNWEHASLSFSQVLNPFFEILVNHVPFFRCFFQQWSYCALLEKENNHLIVLKWWHLQPPHFFFHHLLYASLSPCITILFWEMLIYMKNTYLTITEIRISCRKRSYTFM
jgi:hypothetical protein